MKVKRSGKYVALEEPSLSKPKVIQRELPNVHIGPDLIEHLEEAFPDKLPPLGKASEKELLLRIGSRRVVDHLKNLHRRIEENNKKKPKGHTKK